MSTTDVIDVPERVRELHESSILIDGRDPTFLLYRQLGAEKPRYWEAIRASGLTAITVDVPHVEDTFREAAVNFAAWHERVAARDDALIVRTVEDIRQAKRTGATGFILSSQSPTPVENDLRLLRALYALGLRVMELTYQKRNLLADGCGEPGNGGLSVFGRTVIAEMNRLGIAIDLSHAGDRTMVETIEESAEPVFFSHSNARALADTPRNVPDDTLRRLAERGGVCCISAYADFLREGGSVHGTTLRDYVDMVDYVVQLIGIEHVGMGFDVGEERTEQEVAHIGGADPAKRYVQELRSRTDLIKLTDHLSGRGYADDDVRAILGENLLRFYGTVWSKGENA